MNDPVDVALDLVSEEMERFRELLAQALEPQREYLSEAERELYRRGKKLRPMMLILSAHVAGRQPGSEPPPKGRLSEKVIKASVSLEMLHVATLIHDDIVDAAPLRRGLTSVHADRGTEMAVLIGDLQFIQAVRGFAEAVETQEDIDLVRMVLDTGFNICCGELDELMVDPNLEPFVLRNKYFRTIDRKTAMLFGLACESGASLVRSGKKVAYLLSRFGRCMGRAFQIMDDLLDCARATEDAGKLQGTDLAQGRLSLPIVYAMEELGADHPLQCIVRGDAYTEADLQRSVEEIVLSQGFVRAYSEARECVALALNYLRPLGECRYSKVLAAICEWTVDRPIHPETV